MSFAHFAGSAVAVWETTKRVTVADCDSVRPASEVGGYRRHTFFTAGQEAEARARAVKRGTRARQAAGAVHTDMERGFVAAEITFWEDLVRAGGYAAARERALQRVEGRDYVMRDGDVATFRFTPR